MMMMRSLMIGILHMMIEWRFMFQLSAYPDHISNPDSITIRTEGCFERLTVRSVLESLKEIIMIQSDVKSSFKCDYP